MASNACLAKMPWAQERGWPRGHVLDQASHPGTSQGRAMCEQCWKLWRLQTCWPLLGRRWQPAEGQRPIRPGAGPWLLSLRRLEEATSRTTLTTWRHCPCPNKKFPRRLEFVHSIPLEFVPSTCRTAGTAFTATSCAFQRMGRFWTLCRRGVTVLGKLSLQECMGIQRAQPLAKEEDGFIHYNVE